MSAPPVGLDLDAVTPFFAEHVGPRPIGAALIAGGRSNLTYRVDLDDGTACVLRRPPLGHVLATAHDMAREHRVIRALAPTAVPVPRALAFCADDALLGAPFYVMELVEGLSVRADPGFTPALARGCSESLVDVLAAIHAVDPEAVGLGDLGRPAGYMERQVARWAKQWASSQTRDLPGIDELARRLQRSLPLAGDHTLVHGDFRIDNTILDADDPRRVLAVLDWEMSTLGDPLADLGIFLLYWAADEVDAVAVPPARLPGFLAVDEVIARYADRTGRDVSNLDVYRVFAYFKLAIVLEGINARFQMGKTVGEGFETMGLMVAALVAAGLRIADESDIHTLRG